MVFLVNVPIKTKLVWLRSVGVCVVMVSLVSIVTYQLTHRHSFVTCVSARRWLLLTINEAEACPRNSC